MAYNPNNYSMMDDDTLSKYQDLKAKAAATQNPETIQQSSDSSKSNISDTAGAQGFQRGMSGGLGSALMSGGVASMMGPAGMSGLGPYGAAAGLGVMALEGNAQAKQAEEQAKQQEAQQRKQAQLSAINQLMSVSKGLSLGA